MRAAGRPLLISMPTGVVPVRWLPPFWRSSRRSMTASSTFTRLTRRPSRSWQGFSAYEAYPRCCLYPSTTNPRWPWVPYQRMPLKRPLRTFWEWSRGELPAASSGITGKYPIRAGSYTSPDGVSLLINREIFTSFFVIDSMIRPRSISLMFCQWESSIQVWMTR